MFVHIHTCICLEKSGKIHKKTVYSSYHYKVEIENGEENKDLLLVLYFSV